MKLTIEQELDMKIQAMHCAVAVCKFHMGTPDPSDTLKHAEAYYKFLTGESDEV